uniref:Uncharacterized protein n=1 Tax=Caenorhabditis japonica TaxID=281687 RepID=A0A8R1IQG7_CAEJA
MTWMTWMTQKAAIKAERNHHQSTHTFDSSSTDYSRSTYHGQKGSHHRGFHGVSPFGRGAPSTAGSTSVGEERRERIPFR